MKELRKILLVDEDQLTSSLNKTLLDEMDAAEEVITFTCQWEAFSYIVEVLSRNDVAVGSAYDLVFLDINVADRNDYVFLRDLEAFRIDGEKLRLVILSDNLDIKRSIKLSDFGSRISAYLSHPIHKEAVVTLLASIQEKEPK